MLILNQLAFSGIHILNPHLIESFPNEQVFSVIKAYLKIAATEDIHAYVSNDLKWIDVGKVDSLDKAGELYKSLINLDDLTKAFNEK